MAVNTVLSLAFAIACFYVAIRQIDWSQQLAILAQARAGYLLLAVAFMTASYILRAVRWRSFFPASLRKQGLGSFFPVLMVGYLANNLVPARGGDLARVILFARDKQVSRIGVLSTVVLERLFDALVLSLVGWFAARELGSGSPAWLGWLTLFFSVVCGGLLVLGFQRRFAVECLSKFSSKFPGHLSNILVEKFHVIADYLRHVVTIVGFLRVATLSSAIWGLEAVVYLLVGQSLAISFHPFQLGIFITSVNFASLVPFTPGGIGTIELLATEALVLSGFAREPALTVVAAQHGLQYLFCIVYGLYYARRMGILRTGLPSTSWSRHVLDVDQMVARQAESYPDAVRHFQTAAPTSEIDVSVVVPAYNEEGRILPTLLSIVEYFSASRLSYEVIVVDDGSVDGTTELVREVGRRFPAVSVIRLPRNMGKGAAVRTGMRSASGRFIVFNDADGATPISEVRRLLTSMDQGADIAIGSRALYSAETHVERRLGRAVAGRIFAFLVNAWVVPGIADTQCGFKMFRRHVARKIFEIQRLHGFAFDVEVLRIASVLGHRVVEVPINWTDMSGSKVNMIRDSLRMFRDICLVRYLVPTCLAGENRWMHLPAAQSVPVNADKVDHRVNLPSK